MYNYSDQKTITDFSETNIESEYDKSFVFTRLGKGVMQQIYSLRVDLGEFGLSSENRRVLNKNEDLKLEFKNLPLESYDWRIGKLAKDFYDQKAGKNTMSVNKIKELMAVPEKSNFNMLLSFRINFSAEKFVSNSEIGFCICYESTNIIHYSYPFYKLQATDLPRGSETTLRGYKLPNLGMAMMLKAILWAKENKKKYIYLGSDNKYKHQFKGLEIFNGKKWGN